MACDQCNRNTQDIMQINSAIDNLNTTLNTINSKMEKLSIGIFTELEEKKKDRKIYDEYKRGTSKDSYADVITWDCREYLTAKRAAIKNADSNNQLLYKIFYNIGVVEIETAEESLSAGNVRNIEIDVAATRLRVQIKNSVTGSNVNYYVAVVGVR